MLAAPDSVNAQGLEGPLPAETASVYCLLARTQFKRDEPVWVDENNLPVAKFGSATSNGSTSLRSGRVTATVKISEPGRAIGFPHPIELKIADRKTGHFASAEGMVDLLEAVGSYRLHATLSNRENGKRVDYQLQCQVELDSE